MTMNSGLVVNQKSHMKREIRFGSNVPINWKISNSIYYMNLPIYQQGWPHSIHELYWERQLKTCGPIIEEKTDNEKWNKWHKKHIMKINPENT